MKSEQFFVAQREQSNKTNDLLYSTLGVKSRGQSQKEQQKLQFRIIINNVLPPTKENIKSTILQQ